MRRVVVTGLGMVSPIGNTVEESWNNALAGKSGIGVITQFDASSFGSRTTHLSVPDSRRDCQHGLGTALHHAQSAGTVPGLFHSLHDRFAQHR